MNLSSKYKKFASKLCENTAYKMLAASKKIYLSQKELVLKEWQTKNGDLTLRLDYNLDEDSIVFDIGGYVGQWASDIYSKYNCQIHIFEPVKKFSLVIKDRFKNNKKIILHDVGLGNKTFTTNIVIDDDASSTHTKGKNIEQINIVDIKEFVEKNKIKKINLMKINIEGGEYDLLNRLIESELLPSIEHIQIQFHDFVPNAEVRMTEIQRKLKKTHVPSYQYPFIWESWYQKQTP